ncbi:MAG: T9SS type A sorting domain-containing protein [Ignavibacteria bacterium]|nr:T9SS type A sorting domain-containing protein [Ignavibacteria bacterium]
MKSLILLLWILFLPLLTDVHAGNFTVSNVTQFQTALNTAAANGQNDTINVLAGTYNVNPALTFSSTENYSLLIRGTGSPVLDGGGARRILLLTTTSVNAGIYIEGLTIRNGQADYGGGINIATQGANISIKNCTINSNTAGFVAGGANLFSNTGNITVMNCSFSSNSSPNTSGYPYGTAGGLFIQTDGAGTTITLTGSTFQSNTAHRDAAGAMLYPLGANSTVIAEYNTFTNNNAREAGGGCWIRTPSGNTVVRYRNNTLTGNLSSVAGNGGGTYIQIASGTIILFDNVHTGNSSVWQGGGLWIEHSGGTINFCRNRFANNSSGEAGGGAHIFLESGTARIDHNIFNKNRTTGAGGGLNISTNTGVLNIYNNTFFLNTSPEGGDVNLYFDNASSSSNFYNNILYKSSLPALTFSGQQSVTARYSDIQGGAGNTWFGTGCIDIYPYFADTAAGNYHLQDSIYCGNLRSSKCIDAGDPAVQDSILNCSWGLRLSRSDIGAYGGKFSVSIGIKKLYENIPEEYLLYQNYPNPFNPVTKIRFSVIKTDAGIRNSVISLRVFDVLGRHIKTLVNEQLSTGAYEVTFDASDLPGGVYYYVMTAGNFIQSKKLVLIK